ncbi:MAG: CoA-binding protein [Flavobacteriales bacterium]|nr:CoA-binding protein [Flavobacteriales bacterium]
MTGSTLVLGASEKPTRYSNLAVRRLREHGVPVVAIGRRAGRIGDVEILTDLPDGGAIDTVTLYLSVVNQQPWIEPLIKLRPRRVIFNPGTANPAFAKALVGEGVEVEEACTLVMLATGQY